MKIKLQKKQLKKLTQNEKLPLEATPHIAGGDYTRVYGCQDTMKCASRQDISACCNHSDLASCQIGFTCLC
ncbi:hypothetical protein CEX98_11510 [Pseudoalteromonas piscicida]|uniref:Uncharacterized protein n=1 Tax=Pseudoalteromonas piscicida TaxID=43662 RepID=A0A2A5JQ38_PSEO7|nr:hypothetical protein CEX98_11510 [Pseudoalteromonas piscicida]